MQTADLTSVVSYDFRASKSEHRFFNGRKINDVNNDVYVLYEYHSLMSNMEKLENEIDSIEQLHAIRNSACEYRKQGLKQLAEISGKAPDKNWDSEGTEPNDLLFTALLKMMCRREFALSDHGSVQALEDTQIRCP